MTEKPVIVWFRRDLRLRDHAPLSAAAKKNAPLIPLYIYDTLSPDIEKPGAASRWWLHHSLTALGKQLKAAGQTLILRRGPAVDVLKELIEQTGASDIYFHHAHIAGEANLESDIAMMAGDKGATCHRYPGELLFEPSMVRTGKGEPYKVFTPFWRSCLAHTAPSKSLPQPALPRASIKNLQSEPLAGLSLTPKKPDWARSFPPHWQPGEAGAQAALELFLAERVSDYKKQRDYPAIKGTSRLSPHLHYGEISPREIWHKAEGMVGADEFLREIGWREFCYHLIHHWPELEEQPFRGDFAAFPWQENQGFIEAWQKGMTGYPIIDAGMRELWQTGWMHNRVRMIAASFLTKNLRQHWHVGRNWFWDTLVDADLANNSAGWQWVAGSGADAAPYFRIFNPVTQSEKFDREGDYIRTYVPELKTLTSRYIHDPTNAPESVLKEAGVRLGRTYPTAMVDLKATREAALKAYKDMKAEAEE